MFIAFNINHSSILPLMALNSLYCADVPLSNYSLTHSRLGRVPHSSSKEPLGLLVQDFLQAGCPFCHPTNSVKALKKNNAKGINDMFTVSICSSNLKAKI